MKPRKKNSFFTFLFSFIPGIAEMYMGFMKSGLSLLAAFVLPFMITAVMYSADYLSFISIVVYAVGFFHARNLATTPQEQFDEIRDQYIWEEIFNIDATERTIAAYKKWIAVGFIFIGGCGVWGLFTDSLLNLPLGLTKQELQTVEIIIDFVPRVAFSILIIVIGVLMIMDKRKNLIEDQS